MIFTLLMQNSGSLSKDRMYYLIQELTKRNQVESLQWRVVRGLAPAFIEHLLCACHHSGA